MKHLLALAAATALLSACGNTTTDSTTASAPASKQTNVSRTTKSTPSPLAQIKATERAYLKAMQHDRIGAMCRLTANHATCLETVATLHALGLKPSDTLKGNEEERIDSMKVTIDGNHAGTGRGHELLRRDGRWLMVIPPK